MATSNIEYLGKLRTKNIHERSGNMLVTDAPVDNHGRGEAFSPTDLMSTSLANCIFTIMGIRAEEAGFSLIGATAEMEKTMASNPRRVAEIKIDFDFSMLKLTEEQKELLRAVPPVSPVAISLHPDVKQNINLKF
ncbi:MAG: OsmC family protein [Bacteroidales bacterium]